MNTRVSPLPNFEGYANQAILIDVIYGLALPQDMVKDTLPLLPGWEGQYLREVRGANNADLASQGNWIAAFIDWLR
jgi:hypothetical protein